MELRTYLSIIRRKLWIILVSAAILLTATLLLVQLIPPKYSATARLQILTPKSGGANYVDFNIYYASRIMNTYASLASSPTVIQKIRQNLNLTHDPDIQVSVIADSELIRITAEESDPTLSAVIANSMAEYLVDLSGKSSQESKTSTIQAIDEKLNQINSELAESRKVYKQLINPYMDNQNKVTTLNAQIQSDQQLYISLKNIYEQNIQLVHKDDAAITALNDQILSLETSIQKNQTEVSRLLDLVSDDSIQIDAARGDITLKEQEYTNLVTQLDQIQSLAIIQGGNQLTIEENAVPPKKQSSPNNLLVVAIGILFSGFISLLIAFVWDNLDDKFQYGQQVEQWVDGSFLGDAYLRGNPFERWLFRFVSRNLLETRHTFKKIHRIIQKEKYKLICTCGTESRDGNVSITIDMAREFAKSGLKVLLMNGNRSSQEFLKVFPDLVGKPGLFDYLSTDLSTGGISADAIFYSTTIPQLSVIPAGDPNPIFGRLLSSKKMLGLLQTVKKSYDLVMMVIPPFLIDSEIDDLVNHIDGIVVCFHQGISRLNNVRYVSRQVLEIEAPVIGYVVVHGQISTDLRMRTSSELL